MLRDPANGTYFSRQEQHHGLRKYFFVLLNKNSGIYYEFSFEKKAYRTGLELKKSVYNDLPRLKRKIWTGGSPRVIGDVVIMPKVEVSAPLLARMRVAAYGFDLDTS